MDLHNILIPLYEAEVKKLRAILKRRRFEFAERAHAHFTAKKGRLSTRTARRLWCSMPFVASCSSSLAERRSLAKKGGTRRGSLRGMCWSGWCWVGSLGALLRGAARG